MREQETRIEDDFAVGISDNECVLKSPGHLSTTYYDISGP